MEFKIKNYWDNKYSQSLIPSSPSNFAEYCFNNYITKNTSLTKTLLDLGCGNGRDSIYFAHKNITTTSVDLSEGILKIQNLLEHDPNFQGNPNFICSNAVNAFDNINTMDYVYMRWFLHALEEKDEAVILQKAYEKLNTGGMLFIEVRSINDHLFGKGTKISNREYITDHYRRFHEKSELISKLETLGFNITYNIEGSGFSKYRGDNPILIRIIAQK